MVHEGLVLELAIESTMVANAIPRLDADEGGILAKGAPESTNGCLVINGDSRLAIDIEEHGTVGLALVDLHAVVAEEALADLDDTHISIQRNIDLVVGPVSIATQNIDRLLAVELDNTLGLTTRQVEGGVPAYLEVNLLGVGILDMPNDMNLIAFQTIGDGQIEVIGIDLQRLLALMEGKGHLVVGLANKREVHVAGKTMTRQMILATINPIGLVVNTTNDRKQDWRMARPLRSCLPHILTSVTILHTLELGSFFSDTNGQLFILQFYHKT